MTRDAFALPPACMKCEQVTGKSTCFPGPCVFYHERGIPGTKAHDVATIDRIRRGARETVHVATCPCGCGGDPFICIESDGS